MVLHVLSITTRYSPIEGCFGQVRIGERVIAETAPEMYDEQAISTAQHALAQALLPALVANGMTEAKR